MGPFARLFYMVVLGLGLAYVFAYYNQYADHLEVCQKLIGDVKTTDRQLREAGCVQ